MEEGEKPGSNILRAGSTLFVAQYAVFLHLRRVGPPQDAPDRRQRGGCAKQPDCTISRSAKIEEQSPLQSWMDRAARSRCAQTTSLHWPNPPMDWLASVQVGRIGWRL